MERVCTAYTGTYRSTLSPATGEKCLKFAAGNGKPCSRALAAVSTSLSISTGLNLRRANRRGCNTVRAVCADRP